jgi:microcystin degradation protein MlrC
MKKKKKQKKKTFPAKVGDTILTSYEFLARDSADYKRAQWFPILIGRSLPGGIVTREAYESLMTKMLDGLKKTSLTRSFSLTYTAR